ncbi:MAG: DUF441 domain-containing protein [Clostridia bacterium]|nr:DUF441 domain-containing protein [Clostridia bacterium]
MLILILLLAIVGRSQVIAVAAALLLLIQVARLDRLLPLLERRSLEIGLVFLTIAVLAPFASGKVPMDTCLRSFLSIPGLIAMVSGILATIMNGQGLHLLQEQPGMMVGLVVGSLVGVLFFGGIPVGPLMAGGIAALFTWLANLRS